MSCGSAAGLGLPAPAGPQISNDARESLRAQMNLSGRIQFMSEEIWASLLVSTLSLQSSILPVALVLDRNRQDEVSLISDILNRNIEFGQEIPSL
jgi:hypothetical protein